VNAGRHLHHIADDRQRDALMHYAVHKGIEQARGDFMFGMAVDDSEAEHLTLMAHDAWETFCRHVEFDYPQYARTLFLHGFRSGYRTHLLNLAASRHASAHELVAAVETQMGLSSS
jgi:hypothetical protein